MFKNHLKIALRTLMSAKAYTGLNVFGLAIGLTCVSLIAAWSFHELSYDRFHSKHQRIFRVTSQVKTDSETFGQAVTSPPIAAAMVKDYPEVESAVRLDMNDCIVRYGEKQFEEDGVLFVDQSFFDIFDYTLARSDLRNALQDPYSIVLTESIARKYFPKPGSSTGYENPVSKVMTLFVYDPDSRGAPYKVTGVIPDPPENAHFTFTILGSFSTCEAVMPDAQNSWLDNGFYTYLLLQEGADPVALERRLEQFAERYMGDRMRDLQMFYTYSLQPLTDIHLHSHLRYEIQATGNIHTVYTFATIGLFILLIACINYMNLATARSLGRAKEVGVKKVLGAPKSQLVRQFLVEATMVAVLSLGFALLFVELLRPGFFELTGVRIDRVFSGELLMLISGITLLVGLLSGLYPAFFVSSVSAAHILKGDFKTSATGVFMRKGLVIVQFSIAIVLLAGIIVVNSQMDFIHSKDLGFDKNALLLLKVSGYAEVKNDFAPFKSELLSNPAVRGVSVSRGTIASSLGNSHIETIDGRGKAISTSIYRLQVDADFLSVYAIKLLAGRDFTTGDPGAHIVNEAAVRTFGWGDPEQALGKPFRSGSRQGEITGVVKDFHYGGLQEAIAPVAINLTQPTAFSRVSIRLETANFIETIAFVERTWRKHFPAALLQYQFMDERLDRQYHEEKLFGNIFMAFVVLSLIIACLGLLGLAAYAARQRTKEFGVRKVVGATVTNLVALLAKDFVKLVLFANLIAWPTAWFVMNKWLQSFAYRIDIAWWVFTLAGGLAMLIALVTVSTQAIRAALANPVEALRYE